jgi:LCP family protein required for cell wall assembly
MLSGMSTLHALRIRPVLAALATVFALGASFSPAGAPGPVAAAESPSRRVLGTDGRLTVLLLGIDGRNGTLSGRTDTMMIVSVDPASGRSSAVSIPRDVVGFPLPGRRTYAPKLNSMYMWLSGRTRDPGGQMRRIVGAALGVEIDAYVLIGFRGFRRGVGNVGGLDVVVRKTFYDPYYWVSRTRRGFGLRAGRHHLSSRTALYFARTRKGDNDFERARRQQQLVMSAVTKVRTRGLAGLAMLIVRSRGLVRTDLPLTSAPLIFNVVARSNLATARRTVFGPRTFATAASGYGFRLRVDVCRRWIRLNFPPIHRNGIWPPPAAPAPAPPQAPIMS